MLKGLMTKPQFINVMSANPNLHDFSRGRLEEIYNSLFAGNGIIAGELSSGYDIKLGELGVLKVKDMPARKGRNPASGELIYIPACRKITFQVCKTLKDIVNY